MFNIQRSIFNSQSTNIQTSNLECQIFSLINRNIQHLHLSSFQNLNKIIAAVGTTAAEIMHRKNGSAIRTFGLSFYNFDIQFSIFKERIFLDKADPNILVDELTTIDHNLTKPWSVVHKYKRIAKVEERPVWREVISSRPHTDDHRAPPSGP